MRRIAGWREGRCQHLHCLCGRTCAEQNPTQADENRGCKPAQRSPKLFRRPPLEITLPLLDHAMRDQQHAVVTTPDQKQQARPVPDAESGHGENQRQIAPPDLAPCRRKREEKIVANPERQRHMPARPKYGWIRRCKRPLKILRNCDTERFRSSHSNVRVTGEIEEELQSVAKRETPNIGSAPSRCAVKSADNAVARQNALAEQLRDLHHQHADRDGRPDAFPCSAALDRGQDPVHQRPGQIYAADREQSLQNQEDGPQRGP